MGWTWPVVGWAVVCRAVLALALLGALGARAAMAEGAATTPGAVPAAAPRAAAQVAPEGAPAPTTPTASPAPAPTPVPGAPDVLASRSERLGTSVEGRPIRARVLGDPSAPHRVLVVGCIHGTERAGIAVTKALRRARPAEGTAWWIVDSFNPDRCTGDRRMRGNARGVDLNRNSPWRWRTLDPPGGTYYAGPRAQSEPETRAVLRTVRRVRPDVTVWFHQHATLVDLSRGDRSIIRRYGRRVGLPAVNYGTRPGSLATWQASAFPRSTPFVVELPAGPLPSGKVRAHVAAIGDL